MANLHYEILTDPGQLQVSGSGKDEESPGAVHIIVSNPNAWSVTLYELELTVPFGSGSTHLTAHPDRIKAHLTGSTLSSSVGLTEDWKSTTGIYRLEALSGVRLRKGEVLVIELTGFPVSSEEGLVRLSMAEDSHGRGARNDHLVTLSLLKRASRVPRNFRADQTLLGATDQVTLRWDGPDDLQYTIQGPEGGPQPVQQTSGPWHWSPKQGEEPKRDATYILIASPKSPQQPGYYLTTTVHVRSPEFEGVTATAGVSTPSVRGRDGGAGWIRFPADGITVGHGSGSDLGVVTADRIRVNGVNTTWVGDVDGGKGWIEFPQSGVNVRKDGTQDWGTLAADKADLTGINTSWVQGRTTGDGWIEFPAAGLNVFQGAGDRQWGTVAAGTADLNDLVTHRARVKERLNLEGGLTVDDVLETQDGPPRLIVHGRLDAEGDVLAGGEAVVAGDLTTKSMLRVFGESRFRGKVNANGHLSVRNDDTWIMHTNDGQISVQGDLRVHGAFRSDS
ncbi:hypothetical protein [Streptomyces sp. NPDC093111]|uniref:hypothetical protein n=1 Tax=Streptomyces sp. NPDC093111 TaxID=3154978 RepID=UPI00341D03DE